jgi:acyl carrier protein
MSMPVSFLENLKIKKMEKEILIEKLKEIVKPYVQDQVAFEQLTEETDFINDLKVNSANLIDIVLDVEDVFDIEIDNESMEQMLNVKKAIEIIRAKMI